MQIRVSDREKETLNEDIWIKIKKKKSLSLLEN